VRVLGWSFGPIPVGFDRTKAVVGRTRRVVVSWDENKKPLHAERLRLSFFFDYPPKSSKLTFSGGTPKSSTIFRTAAFISGGPQK